MQHKKPLLQTISLAGTTIAFFIGSGFATGQELVQYFAAHGWGFLLVIALSMALFLYTNSRFIRAGADGALQTPGGIYAYFCGRWIGRFYDVFSAVFIYLSFVVMCGGAGAAVQQQLGLPAWVGIFGLAVLAAVTVAAGLNGLVRVLGKLGPLLISCILFTSIVTTFRDHASIASGVALVESGGVSLLRVGRDPFLAGISYAGFVMLWFCKFMAELGTQNDPRSVLRGMCCGSGCIALALAFSSLALLANIAEVAGSSIPNVLLAQKISPLFAAAFTGVTLCSTYTAGVPLLWTVARTCRPEGTPAFRLCTAALALSCACIALFLPYGRLVNIVYGINGYVGVALVFFLIRKDLLRRRAHT